MIVSYKIIIPQIIIPFFGIFLLGCQEKFPTYAAFCDQNGTKFPSCLHYAVLDEKERGAIQKSFGIKGDNECPYRVELTKYHVGNCNNPIVKSVGSDFDGYIRIEIKKGIKCYYKVQSDFKSDENAAFDRVLKKIENEKKIENFSN